MIILEILVITMPKHAITPDESHWMTVSGVVPLVVLPISEML